MDDYNIGNLYEAKNEYCARLVNILNPQIQKGVQSLFLEAKKLCFENEEESQYLVTFQNFLSRIPKWNQTIIDDETNRILSESNCSYLEDLITCVHICQLKILTTVRVGQKQKRVEIDIPSLQDFVHRVYIQTARKLYSNAYLFELNVSPLNTQKNMRECELIIRECILLVIRDSIPLEQILRNYLDETVEEDVEIQEEIIEPEPVVEEVKTDDVGVTIPEEDVETVNVGEDGERQEEVSTISKAVEEARAEESSVVKVDTSLGGVLDTPFPLSINTEDEQSEALEKSLALSFNDVDSVLNMDTNRQESIVAPKDTQTLEDLSDQRYEERRLEEDSEEEEDGPIKILGPPVQLGELDIQDLSKPLSISKPELGNVMVLQ